MDAVIDIPVTARRSVRDWFAIKAALQFRQVICRLVLGHEYYKHVVPGRVTMLCVVCKHQTPGLAVSMTPLPLRFTGDTQRHRLRV